MGGSVEKALKNLPESYAALSASVLAGPIPRIKRVFDDTKLTDHHAIIPTGRRADPQALSPDEAKLFDLIADVYKRQSQTWRPSSPAGPGRGATRPPKPI